MPENSIVSLGELTRPVNTLVERASDAVGGLFRPWQTRRVARAEADAALISAESEVQVTELHKRAFWRFLEEEATKQTNMENILVKAIPSVDQENARPEDIADDWLSNFFDKCRLMSDDDMQGWWARILAGEANHPGRFSRRTVNLMADLDKSDAELFECLCGFIWTSGTENYPLVFDVQHDIYNRRGISFISMGHLESLGLVRFNSITGFSVNDLSGPVGLMYHGNFVRLNPRNSGGQFKLALGKVLLTQAGIELSRICETKPVDRFFEYVYDKWASESLVPPRSPV